MPLNILEEKIENEKPPEERKLIGRSSDMIAYAFNDSDIKDLPNLRDKIINVIYSLEGLPANFNAKSNLLLLVDDFIGSGETVDNCESYATSVSQLDLSKLF